MSESDRPDDPGSASRGLVRSSAVMVLGTSVSRVTGVARDIAMTAALGFFVVADAYSLGNGLPNIVYILVVGGALNAVFIPQLVRHMKDDLDGGKAYADRLLTLVFTALVVVTILAVAGAPWIVRLYATSAYSDAQLALAIAFAQLCLPQILFYGAYALLSQVLNARGKFGAPMFAPVINNIIAIAMFLGFLWIAGPQAAADGQLSPTQVAWLGIGTTLGVAAQALVLLPVLWRSGYSWRPRFDWKGAGLGKTGSLAVWTIGLVLVNQLAYVVVTRLATLANVLAETNALVPAGLTTYQKAHLVFILPHSIVTVSIVTALLPGISRAAHAGDLRSVSAGLASSIQLAAAVVVPIASVMFVVSPAITGLMFGFGASTSASAGYTGFVVMAFLVGLLPFTIFYILLRGWYALEDTRTPFLLTLGFNLVMLAIMVPVFYLVTDSLKVISMALSYSVAYWLILGVALWLLSRRLGGLQILQTSLVVARLVLAGVVAAGATVGVVLLAGGVGSERGALTVLLVVLVSSITGAVVFLGAALLLRIEEVRDLLSMLRGRIRH